jgi:hypothetical protein
MDLTGLLLEQGVRCMLAWSFRQQLAPATQQSSSSLNQDLSAMDNAGEKVFSSPFGAATGCAIFFCVLFVKA